ncbi:MAG: SDR family oxidoreductase [Firmicutes bacterium]|jgi:NAD(P)-dependent dehydrogenase (short-subunit alcohol dehydrogenase family)|nr:SDR family oxidoreductase [Bacillota bacterium]
MKRTVLITGTSSGFGKLTTKLFSENGWNVIATMRNTENAAELKSLENVLVEELDVCDYEGVKRAIKNGAAKFGRIDAVVNNAGYGTMGFLEETSEEDYMNLFDTNVFGPVRVIKASLPHLRKNGGVIVNVSSIAGLVGAPMMSLYSASKFAVDGLTESLAFELNEFDIKVKSVAPGGFNTNFQSSSVLSLGERKEDLEESRNEYMKFTTARREKMKDQPTSDPQDVADQIYRCVTEETPLRNPVGADCKMLYGMKKEKSDLELFAMMTQLALPPKK